MTPTPEYIQFITVTGALSKLVIISMLIERGLAFIFEHHWFVKATTSTTPDTHNPLKQIVINNYPGLKGVLALTSALGICLGYHFDILAIIFGQPTDSIGEVITGFVAAGGSSGAIAIFQGFLNINKDSRDALLAAKKAQADSIKDIAEAEAAAAKARQQIAEAELEIIQAKIPKPA